MNQAYLSLGSNLGNRFEMISKAISLLNSLAGKVETVSSFFESAPWGNTDQPGFINTALLLNTKFSAEELMTIILSIEKGLGRERNKKWEPRTIDIDIIYFNHEIVTTENLTIPHPYMHQRKFVLMPMVEIAFDLIHPVFEKNSYELLNQCNDTLAVEKIPSDISSTPAKNY